MTHHSFDRQDQMLLAAVEAHKDLLAYCKAAEEVSLLCCIAHNLCYKFHMYMLFYAFVF
jgi:hypothetical protein